MDEMAFFAREAYIDKVMKHLVSIKIIKPDNIHDSKKTIQSIIDFAHSFEIYSEINILNLSILFYSSPFTKKINTEQGEILKNRNWNEDKRTEEFYLLTMLNS